MNCSTEESFLRHTRYMILRNLLHEVAAATGAETSWLAAGWVQIMFICQQVVKHVYECLGADVIHKVDLVVVQNMFV